MTKPASKPCPAGKVWDGKKCKKKKPTVPKPLKTPTVPKPMKTPTVPKPVKTPTVPKPVKTSPGCSQGNIWDGKKCRKPTGAAQNANVPKPRPVTGPRAPGAAAPAPAPAAPQEAAGDPCVAVNAFVRAVDADLGAMATTAIQCSRVSDFIDNAAQKYANAETADFIQKIATQIMDVVSCHSDLVTNVAEMRRFIARVTCSTDRATGATTTGLLADRPSPPVPQGFVIPRLWDPEWTPTWAKSRGWVQHPYYDWLMPIKEVPTDGTGAAVSTPARDDPPPRQPRPGLRPVPRPRPAPRPVVADGPQGSRPTGGTVLDVVVAPEAPETPVAPEAPETPVAPEAPEVPETPEKKSKKWIMWVVAAVLCLGLLGVAFFFVSKSQAPQFGAGDIDTAFDASAPPTDMSLGQLPSNNAFEMPGTTDLMNDLQAPAPRASRRSR